MRRQRAAGGYMDKESVRKRPVAAVGIVVENTHREILLVKRAHPPSKGLWAIPGGKIRFGEPLLQAAQREILEETGIHVAAQFPIYAFDLIEQSDGEANFHYLIVDVYARLVAGTPRAADDALSAGWFKTTAPDPTTLDPNTARFLAWWHRNRDVVLALHTTSE